MDKNEIGIAGEFFVLAQLARQGYIATLTLGHAKGIDILVSDSRFKKLYRVEVKTTQQGPHYERRFGKNKFYGWPMSLKHESIRDDNLLYCFVCLGDINEMPKFFIVPSKDVATYVRWQHRFWLKSRGMKTDVTTMRRFRIPIHDPEGYLNNWKAFGNPSNQAVHPTRRKRRAGDR